MLLDHSHLHLICQEFKHQTKQLTGQTSEWEMQHGIQIRSMDCKFSVEVKVNMRAVGMREPQMPRVGGTVFSLEGGLP